MVTGSAAVAEINTLTKKKVTRKHTVKTRIVFIVQYFMIGSQKHLALAVISLLLVVDRGYDPLSRGYRPRALAIELIH